MGIGTPRSHNNIPRPMVKPPATIVAGHDRVPGRPGAEVEPAKNGKEMPTTQHYAQARLGRCRLGRWLRAPQTLRPRVLQAAGISCQIAGTGPQRRPSLFEAARFDHPRVAVIPVEGALAAVANELPGLQGCASRYAATASISARRRFWATPCMTATLRMLLWKEASCFRTYCACWLARRG